jgi:hypothetical protein
MGFGYMRGDVCRLLFTTHMVQDTTRLGQHAAAAVSYLLAFSPLSHDVVGFVIVGQA